MTQLALEMLGPDAALGEDNAPYGGYWQYQQLRSRGNTIEAGDLGGPPQHRRRARARPPQVALRRMDFTFTPEQEALREQAREFLAANAGADLGAARGARLDRGLDRGGGRRRLTFVEEAVLFEELGRTLYHGPYFLDDRPGAAALRPRTCAEVAAGRRAGRSRSARSSPTSTQPSTSRSWGDGIYELEGASGILATTDETRPLGSSAAVTQGGPGRLDGPRRGRGPRTALAIEACGVARRALELAIEYAASREQFGQEDRRLPGGLAPARGRVHAASSSRVRSRCGRRGASRPTTRRRRSRPRRRLYAGERAVGVCETAIQGLGGIGFTWEHRLHRLYKRALGIQSFGESGTRLRAEIAA